MDSPTQFTIIYLLGDEAELREKRAKFPKKKKYSFVLGVNVVITRRYIKQLIRSEDKKMFLRDTNENSC